MRSIISKNLAKPSSGLGGYLISKFFVKNNKYLELAASELCDIQQHDQVLEVGFGPGLGLQDAFRKVSEGSGSIHGIDISPRMYKMASKNLKQEIAMGKIQLHMASVADIPYPADTFDSIFHCNCYYFWPNMEEAVQELHRVIKPDKNIIATLDLSLLQRVVQKGLMQCGNTDPDRYMTSLERNGFHTVYIKDMQVRDKKFQAIYATAKK